VATDDELPASERARKLLARLHPATHRLVEHLIGALDAMDDVPRGLRSREALELLQSAIENYLDKLNADHELPAPLTQAERRAAKRDLLAFAAYKQDEVDRVRDTNLADLATAARTAAASLVVHALLLGYRGRASEARRARATRELVDAFERGAPAKRLAALALETRGVSATTATKSLRDRAKPPTQARRSRSS